MSTHYNIQVKIQKVSKAERPDASSYSRSNPPAEPGREVEDVVSASVRADSLEAAVHRVVGVITASTGVDVEEQS